MCNTKTPDNIGDVDHGYCRNRLRTGKVKAALTPKRGRKDYLFMSVFVISKKGERLMPTNRLGKVRHMLKDGRAIIYQRNPFTIQLTYETTEYIQPIEFCQDTGYQHIGTSVKSTAEEYVAAQHDLLLSEKENHDDCCKYRRTRRNHKHYRAPQFDNRRTSKKPGCIAPSLRNKADRHIDIIRHYIAAVPITSVTIEIGQFDRRVLKATAEGKPISTGIAYQYGHMYGVDTLREAFSRETNTPAYSAEEALSTERFLMRIMSISGATI